MKFRKAIASLLAASMMVSALPAGMSLSAADTSVSKGENSYFYQQLEVLPDVSQKFYDAMVQMAEEGIFISGKDLDLVESGYFTSDEVMELAEGPNSVLKLYGAARDAFSADYPDLFYVDFSALSIRINAVGDEYHLYIGSGRRDNYRNEGFKDAAAVQAAVKEYNAALKKAVSAVDKSAEALAAKNDRTAPDAADIVEAAHDYVTKNTSYRLEDKFEDGDAAVNLVRTSYGSLVNRKAVCEGYARAFKDIMDEEGIPCVLVQGAYQHSKDVFELHEWTYVQIGESWYAVDPTMDDPFNTKKYKEDPNALGVDGYESHEYLLKGENIMAVKYATSGILSEANFEFSYPALAFENYGADVVYSDNGLIVSVETGKNSDGIDAGCFTISYHGMGYKKMLQEGYYLLWRPFMDKSAGGEGEYVDDGWQYLDDPMNYGDPDTGTYNPDLVDDESHLYMVLPQVAYVQYAVTTIPYETYTLGEYTFIDPTFYGDPKADLTSGTGVIYNPEGSYKAPAYPKNTTPALTSPLFIDGTTYTIRSEFNKPLVLSGSLADVGLDIDIIEGLGIKNDSALKHSKFGNMTIEYADGTTDKVNLNEAGRINGTAAAASALAAEDKKDIVAVSFEFKPSDMYADDSIIYEFSLRGIIGKEDRKVPMNLTYGVIHRCSRCPLRHYDYDWELFGKPTLMEDLKGADFSEWSFAPDSLDEGEDQESARKALKSLTHRMVLMSETPTENRQEQLLSELENNSGGLGELSAAVDTSKIEYYNINLTVCKMQVVKTGDSIKLSLGFPAGYGPEDKGTTFKVYHFSTDEFGNITGVNEIPCVVTEYGLIVYCDSFSPFAIVPIDLEKLESSGDISDELKAEVLSAAAEKTVVFADTFGGSVSCNGSMDGAVVIGEGDTAEITVKADKDYAIDAIVIGGKTYTVSDRETMTISLSYDELASGSTVVNAMFAAKSVHEKEAENNASVVVPGTAPAEPEHTHDYSSESGKCKECGEFRDGISGLNGHSLTLDGKIGINFSMELAESVVSDSKAVMRFTLPDGTSKDIPVSEAEVRGESCIFTCELPAKDVRTVVTAQIITGDGKKGTEFTYSAAEYAKVILSGDEYSEEVKALVSAMLDYGKSAEAYFGGRRVLESAAMRTVKAEDLSQYKASTAGELPEGISYVGASLILESETTLRHYFAVDNGTDVSGLGFSGSKEGNYYYIEIKNISAQELDTDIPVKVKGFTVNGSPMSYAYTVLEQSDDDNLQRLVKALYLYNKAANEYVS